MNFIHLADTHLGATNYKLKERENDFLNAFKQVIDYAIKNKVEFIVHSGDLFDKGKPGNNILLFTINQLKRLKKEGIRFYTMPGSHDMSVDGTLITVLERVGLLINVAKPSNYENNGEEIIIKGEDAGNAIIYGVPGRRANIKRIYNSIRLAKSNKFKIFMFHHTLSSVIGSEDFADIPITSLPIGADYYAGGHWHEHEEFTYHGKPVIYPGSTEYNSITEMSSGKPRGFIHYKDKPIFKKITTREVKVIDITCNTTPEEATRKAINEITKSNKGLIIIRFKGKLIKGKRSDIDVKIIKKEAENNGWLHCSIKLSDLNNPGEEITTNNKSVNEIERDYLKSLGYNNNEIKIAQEIIRILGNNYSTKDLTKAVNEVLKII